LVIGVAEPESLPRELAAPLPLYSSDRVDGTVLKPSAKHPDKRVRSAIVGRQGASLVFDGGDAVSVRTDQVAGVLCFDDGTRHLLGSDGFHVRIAPEEWEAARPALAALDEALSPMACIPATAPSPAGGTQWVAPTRARGVTSREAVFLVWGLLLLLGGGVALSLGNRDAGGFYPVLGALLVGRGLVLRHRRRSDGGS
jgi:hypothetical protein